VNRVSRFAQVGAGLLRLVSSSVVPVVLWLTGLAVYTVVGVECLFAGREPIFAVARLTAYVTAGTVAAMTVGFASVFAIASGAMLGWLGEQPSPGSIAAATARAFWAVAAYVWLGVALLMADPPTGLSVFEVAEPSALETRFETIAGFAWLARLRYVALGCFLGLVVWFLARLSRFGDAVLAVAFGAALLAALIKGLGLLAGSP